MSELDVAEAAPAPASERGVQLQAAAWVVAVLAVVGAVLGLIWAAWSPPGPLGAVLSAGVQADETEAFVAGDGRFALIVAIVGLAAGFAAWYLPRMKRARGPYVALGLAVGGVAGAALTEWVGYLVRGQGKHFACNSETGMCISHLPLTVHMHALLLVEAVLAVLVYSLFVAFAVEDDLGRPDGNRRRAPLLAYPDLPPAEATSVHPEHGLQHPWREGDAAGAP